MKTMLSWKTGLMLLLGGVALWTLRAQNAPERTPLENTNAPAVLIDTNVEPKVVQAAKVELPPTLAEIVRLAQSGAEESVVVTYVQKAPPYTVTSDQIIYLQDLGVGDSVLKAVVEHSQKDNGVAVTVPEGAPAPALTNVPPPPGSSEEQVSAPTPAQNVVVEAPLTPKEPPPAVAADFYEPLTPYGTWVEIAPYGLCWQPSVVYVNRSWSPYCDRGRWIWTDSGWYWHSYYSWGWAPFHYGRWFHHAHRGWYWCPDRVWGPSWVLWRDSPGYCGWAPLPPGAHFSAGVGWSYHGHHVSHGFTFGLHAPHFTFVARSHFMDHHVRSHALHRHDANVVINKTTVVNNYVVGSGNRVVNRGIDRGQIERATGKPVREVAVRELPRDAKRAVMPDQLTREGKTEVVYRPGPNIQVPQRRTDRTAMAAPRTSVSGSANQAGTRQPVNPRAVPAPRNQQPVSGEPAVPQQPNGKNPARREAAPVPRSTTPLPPTNRGNSVPERQVPQRPDVSQPPPTPRNIPPPVRNAPLTPQRPSQPAPAPTQPRSDPKKPGPEASRSVPRPLPATPSARMAPGALAPQSKALPSSRAPRPEAGRGEASSQGRSAKPADRS
jgi:hypothetical protein